MLIVLDTNLLISDPAFGSGASAILLDYAHRTESRILLSALVLDELHAHRVRSLESQWDAYVRAFGSVRSYLPNAPPPPDKPDYESIARSQLSELKKRLRVRDPDVLPVTEVQLREAVQRAMRRRPPCTDRGEEIRDAVLWLQVLQLARENADTTVAFISANSRQFAAKDGFLLGPLAAEVVTGRVVYYTSPDAFAKQHATPIQFITSEWLQKQVTSAAVYAAAEERLLDLARATLWRSGSWAPQSIDNYGLDLDDFYVYEMQDGTLRVVAIWDGLIEVVVERDADCDYGFNPTTGRHEYHYPVYGYSGYGSRTETKSVDVVVTIEAVVRERVVQSWEVIEVARA